MGEGRGGRRGDFVSSAEGVPLLGTLVGRARDDWWIEAGRPDVFVVVEAGAGPGTLAASILASKPACSQALRYVLVGTSPAQRAMPGSRPTLEHPMSASPSLHAPHETGRARAVPPPRGTSGWRPPAHPTPPA